MFESVDGSTFRAVMRRVPSPVVVVTVPGGEGEFGRGITIGSFSSLALDPPLISFNVARDASMHDLLREADRYAVHVLGEGQAYLAKNFAEPGLTGEEQFESIPHQLDDHGTPIIEGTGLVLHCAGHDRMRAADKTIFVGRVIDVEENADDGAVLYYQRSYRGVGSELRSSLLSPVKRASSESS
jgi:flavin reductase (DIM6/NTAB) family NADH-FMN oxidoreductase RutF